MAPPFLGTSVEHNSINAPFAKQRSAWEGRGPSRAQGSGDSTAFPALGASVELISINTPACLIVLRADGVGQSVLARSGHSKNNMG